MSLRDTTTQFGLVTRGLHWLLTLMIVGMLGLGWYMTDLPKHDPLRHELMNLHKATGVIVLGLVVIFVLWRLFNPRPSNADLPAWQRILARDTHLGIYAAIVVQPLSGLFMTTASGHPPSVYGWFVFPQFLPKDKGLAKALVTLHLWLPYLIAVLIGLHILASLYHHFVRRDNVLKRMLTSD